MKNKFPKKKLIKEVRQMCSDKSLIHQWYCTSIYDCKEIKKRRTEVAFEMVGKNLVENL